MPKDDQPITFEKFKERIREHFEKINKNKADDGLNVEQGPNNQVKIK